MMSPHLEAVFSTEFNTGGIAPIKFLSFQDPKGWWDSETGGGILMITILPSIAPPQSEKLLNT